MAKKRVSVEVPEEEADKIVTAVEAAEIEAGGPLTTPTVEDVAETETAPVEPQAEAPADLPIAEPAAEAPATETPPAEVPAPEVPPVEATEVAAELPTDAHTYYVWKDGVFVKFFTNEEFKGEALKFAKQFAEEIGGTVQI